MALLARQLYFEAVKVGDELPPLVKPPVDRIQIARYAGASGDYNPLYIDELHAKNSGFPSAQAPGMLAMGFLGELVVEDEGRDAQGALVFRARSTLVLRRS